VADNPRTTPETSATPPPWPDSTAWTEAHPDEPDRDEAQDTAEGEPDEALVEGDGNREPESERTRGSPLHADRPRRPRPPRRAPSWTCACSRTFASPQALAGHARRCPSRRRVPAAPKRARAKREAERPARKPRRPRRETRDERLERLCGEVDALLWPLPPADRLEVAKAVYTCYGPNPPAWVTP
jgi:hypothetical protein